MYVTISQHRPAAGTDPDAVVGRLREGLVPGLRAQPGDEAGREAALLELLARPTIVNPTEMPVDEARAAARARPRDADAWHQLGESLDVAGRLDEAVAAFHRATLLPPRVIGRAFLYRDLAEPRERAGDLAGALAAARVSVRSWPLSRDGLFCSGSEVLLLTRLLVRSGDLAGAASFYRPLFRANPEQELCRRIHDALGAAD